MLLDGIRCTIAPTALAHAAPVSEAAAFGKAVDDVLRRPGISPAWIQKVADRWKGHGVPGSGILTAALAERCDQRLPRSWFERLARKGLEQHGFTFEHEVPVSDRGRRIAVLDLAQLPLRVGVECQSWEWHSTPAARAANARRQRRLEALGWDIIELWWNDLGRLDEVAEQVAAAFARQARLHAS